MISFFSEGVRFNLREKLRCKRWLRAVASMDGFVITDLNFIFCSDEYLLDVNRQYLGHDYYTDIITFDGSDDSESNIVSGDIFISIDTVKANGDEYGEGFERELKRVMAHGVLHLTVYDDLSDSDKTRMTEAENKALALWDVTE